MFYYDEADFFKRYLKYKAIKNAFVRHFLFLKADNYLTSFRVREDLGAVGMGYSVVIITERILISLTLCHLERRAALRVCKNNRKMSTDWCLIFCDFIAKDFFGTHIQESSLDFDDIEKYLQTFATKLNAMLKMLGVDGVVEKLDRDTSKVR
ncbi:MAG: hypothetical protein MI750_10080 [Xanthomonadales bacterium]|nr:hypothetical protein [Xanthomonadales bacterium]